MVVCHGDSCIASSQLRQFETPDDMSMWQSLATCIIILLVQGCWNLQWDNVSVCGLWSVRMCVIVRVRARAAVRRHERLDGDRKGDHHHIDLIRKLVHTGGEALQRPGQRPQQCNSCCAAAAGCAVGSSGAVDSQQSRPIRTVQQLRGLQEQRMYKVAHFHWYSLPRPAFLYESLLTRA